MNVVVISVLRLGDSLMHLNLLGLIQAKHPQAQIHLLVQDLSKELVDLLTPQIKIHTFPYHDVQKILVERDRSPLRALNLIQSSLKHLQTQKIDVVYNLSHTRLSAAIASSLCADQIYGASLTPEHNRKQNHWFNYYNEKYSVSGKKLYHQLDVLARICELPTLAESRINSFNSFDSNDPRPVLLQVSASDSKKALPSEWTKNLISALTSRGHRVQMHAAEFEASNLAKEFQDCAHPNFSIRVGNLASVFKRLRESKCLITPDTSLGHLAVMTGTPVLGLHLGSAQPGVTSPYFGESIVWSSGLDCFPCAQSQACSNEIHLKCQKMLSIEVPLNFVESSRLFKGESHHVPVQQGQIHLTVKNGSFLNTVKHSKEGVMRFDFFERSFQQHIWNLFLNDEDLLRVPPFATASNSIRQSVVTDRNQNRELQFWLQQQRSNVIKIFAILEKFEVSLSSQKRQCFDLERVSASVDKISLYQCLQELTDAFPERADEFQCLDRVYRFEFTTAFQFVKAAQDAITEVRRLNQIRNRISEVMIRENSETLGGQYESRLEGQA